MIRLTLTFTFFLVFSSIGFGQQRIRNYVSRNATDIRSISVSDSDYTDLKPIADAIGNARIVMLGEQDHGDAPTFQAKARLVRYLHEQHGFHVLAFESDFFGLTAGYEKTRQGAMSIDSLLKGNLFAIWTGCAQFAGMYQYIKETAASASPLHIAGIDNQLHGSYTAVHLRQLVTKILWDAPGFGQGDKERYLRIYDSLVRYSARGAVKDRKELEWLEHQTISLISGLQADTTTDPFTLMAAQNILSTCRHQQLFLELKQPQDLYTERDKQMALNLQWLTTVLYPGEKIIVWAANGHVSRNQTEVEPSQFRHQSLGSYFTKELGYDNQTYVIGFSSFEGTAGRVTMRDQYKLPPREDQSFERWIDKKGRAFAFLDWTEFRRSNPGYRERFMMSGSGHYQQKGAWQKSFDGVFFIRNMYACDAVK